MSQYQYGQQGQYEVGRSNKIPSLYHEGFERIRVVSNRMVVVFIQRPVWPRYTLFGIARLCIHQHAGHYDHYGIG